MKSQEKPILALVLAVVGLGLALPARGDEWADQVRASCCPRCGQPMSRHTVPVSTPLGFPAPCPPPAPSVGAPPTMPAAPQAVPGAPQPAPGAPPAAPPAAPPTPEAAAPPPAPTAPPTAPEAGAAPPALTTGLGGGLGEAQGALNMFGDLSPPAPPVPQFRQPGPSRLQSAPVVPNVRLFKFADNQTAMPVNRLTFGFNFFDYVNQAVDKRLRIPLNRIEAYRYILGFEKAFWDSRASFGMRLPINNVTADSTLSTLGKTHTGVGDLAMYFKYALWMDRPAGRVLTAGMAISVPTGPSSFAGAPWIRGLHFTTLQPYLAFQWTLDRLYFIGFAAVDIPMSSRDVTVLFNDLSVGYFVYRNPDPSGWLSGVAPTFEIHVNTPTNHRGGLFNLNDLAGTTEVVDSTQGINVFFGKKTILSLGIAEPLTGPKPFSLEALALLNVYY
jgi:hypothetical protein